MAGAATARFAAGALQDVRLRISLLALGVTWALLWQDIGFVVWNPFGSEYHSWVASLGLIWALMALSLSILAGWTGEVSLAHAAFLGVGAWAASEVSGVAPFPVNLLAGIAVGLPVSLALGIPALRLRGLTLTVATLAFMLFMQDVMFGRLIGSVTIPIPVDRPEIAGLDFNNDRAFYYMVLLLVAACFIITWWIGKSLYRRVLVAMGDNHLAFGALGGSVTSHKLLAFALSGMTASLAGVLWGMLVRQVSTASLNVTQSIFFLTFAVVGGRGSLVGALIAGILFGIIPEIYRSIPAILEYTFLMSGVGLIVLLLQAPGGLASIPGEMQRMFARRRQPAEGLAAQGETHLRPDTARLALANNPLTLRAAPVGRERGGGITPPPVLAVEHLAMHFGGVSALTDVSLAVPSGTLVGLIGPNGAGKTTVLNCISGFYRPQTGRVLFGAQDITRWPVSWRALAGIARTFQTPKLFLNLTVEENVMVALQLARSSRLGLLSPEVLTPPRREDEEKATFLLSLVGLKDRARHPASELPHAGARALELARALASSPSILLLDEPVAGMDRSEGEAFGEVLRMLRQEMGLTILVVEHDMTWVMGLCERLFVLDFGVLLAEGKPEQVREDPEVIAAYLGRGVSHVGG